jgi:hypothetical protein
MKIVMWLILIFLTTSCAPLTTTYPSSEIIIGVRDSSTHEPISGATVLSSVNVFFYPVMDDNMFGRGGVIPSFVAINEPDGWTAITDHDGQAFASTAGGSPSNIAILAGGYPMTRGSFNTSPTGRVVDVTMWTKGTVDLATPHERTLEFRILLPQP